MTLEREGSHSPDAICLPSSRQVTSCPSQSTASRGLGRGGREALIPGLSSKPLPSSPFVSPSPSSSILRVIWPREKPATPIPRERTMHCLVSPSSEQRTSQYRTQAGTSPLVFSPQWGACVHTVTPNERIASEFRRIRPRLPAGPNPEGRHHAK